MALFQTCPGKGRAVATSHDKIHITRCGPSMTHSDRRMTGHPCLPAPFGVWGVRRHRRGCCIGYRHLQAINAARNKNGRSMCLLPQASPDFSRVIPRVNVVAAESLCGHAGFVERGASCIDHCSNGSSIMPCPPVPSVATEWESMSDSVRMAGDSVIPNVPIGVGPGGGRD